MRPFSNGAKDRFFRNESEIDGLVYVVSVTGKVTRALNRTPPVWAGFSSRGGSTTRRRTLRCSPSLARHPVGRLLNQLISRFELVKIWASVLQRINESVHEFSMCCR